MVDTVRAIMKRKCVNQGFDPDDVPTFWPVRELSPGFAVMGHVAQSGSAGPAFALSKEILTQHVGVFGHAGSGKSWLVMHLVLEAIRAGLRVWIFDIEDEYLSLIHI